MNDDLLADLLLRWEELHERGVQASAEEICRECPELVGPLTRRIEALEALAWMKADDDPQPAAPEGVMSEAPTRILAGRYRLDKLVGEGGFGQVWLSFDLELERPVAVKVPKPSRRFSPAEIDTFVAEARKLAKLRHPGVVAVHDICRSGGAYFFVSDWIDGSDLASRLEAGRLPQDEAVRLVEATARILAYAHGEGFVHLDIKPANVLLDAHGRPLVCDFGIAATEQDLLQEPKRVLATLAYASPEQLTGRPIDARSDIWSLGVVLYEMLAGRLPFDGPDPVALRDRIMSHDPPPLRTADAMIPPFLDGICRKCLAKNPADRYATAEGLAEALEASRRRPKGGIGRFLAAVAFSLFVLGTLFVAKTYWPGSPPASDQESPREAEGGSTASEPLRSFEGHAGPVLCVAFSPDGKTIASGAADATVRLWNTDGDGRGAVLPQITGCTALAFTEDGKTLACGCENGTVRLWDSGGAKAKEGLVLPGHAGAVTCVAFSPDGKFLVTGGKDGTVRVLDRIAKKPRAGVIPKTVGVVLWTSFSADGKLLVGYGDSAAGPGMFWFWELATKDGNPRLALSRKAPLVGLHDVRSLRVSSAGTLILVAAGNEVYVWSKEGKDSFRVVGSFARPASCVALSPDGRLALSCGRDGLRLWGVETMREEARFAGHDGAVNCVAFSPGGNLAASGGADGTVRLWRTGEKTAMAEPPQLRRLNLDYTPTGDEALRRLTGPDLGELRLTGTKISDDGLACLRDCGRLRLLDLGRTGTTGGGLKHLAGLTGLRHLGLSGTRVTDADLAQLRGYENLGHLNLDHTQITDAGLGHLAALASLTDLRLTRTQVTDAGMGTLAGLKGLRTLHLYHTQVTDAGLEALTGLPDLEDIGLIGTRVTEAGFLRFRKARGGDGR